MNKNTKKDSPTTVEELTAILKWRLNKAPTLEDVTTMLDKHIINKNEAREILFNEVKDTPTSEREEALKEQIKFLEGVVEKLASHNHGWGWINTYTYTPHYPTKYWITSSGTTYTAGAIGSGSGIYNLNANNTVSVNSSLSSNSGSGSAITVK